MQIIHKIDNFLFTIFPELMGGGNNLITNTLQEYYTIGSYKPKVSIQNDWVKIEIDLPTLLSEKADYQKTVALCEKGNYAEAKPLLKNLIEKNPTHSEYHRIMGQILSDEGNQDEAINCLIDALRWDSKNNWALLLMGNIFAKHKKDVKTAMIYYDQAIAANKADHITLANIAYLFFQDHNHTEATKYAWESIKLNSEYPNAHFILSLIAQAENDLQSAFYSTIQAIKFSTKKDTLYQNAVKQAFEIAKKIADDFDGKKIFFSYRSQLEAEGGTTIDIDADEEINTVAKVEIAERYNRDKHIVKYKSTYPAVEHAVMHELVHLDFIFQARKEKLNQVFTSTQQNKNNFIESILPEINALKAKVSDATTVNKFVESMFSGLNLQTYNTPIDLFIEDFLYKEYVALRPYQFLSLFALLQDAINAVTNQQIVAFAPKSIVSKTKTYSLVNAMQFKELFGIDTLQEFNPTASEMKLAASFYKEFIEYREDRKPGEEYELVKHWAQDLGLDTFFALESEARFETAKNIDDFLNKLQADPFGLDEPEDPFQKRDMEKFQKHQEEMGTNMTVVMFMVEALQHFKNQKAEQIKQTAFELAMLGTQGIDPNKKDYIISSISKKRFSGNQILAFYYVAWKLAIPEHVGELGLDYEKEFEMAKKTQQ